MLVAAAAAASMVVLELVRRSGHRAVGPEGQRQGLELDRVDGDSGTVRRDRLHSGGDWRRDAE